jgi:hypothetical protein
MNGPLGSTVSQNDTSIPTPTFLSAIARPASLMPGESLRDFESVRDSIIHDVAPRSGIEWLWTMDLIDLSWDIIRYRTLRQKILETYRQAAVESVLQRIDLAGISPEALPSARNHTRQNATQWHEDSEAAAEIESRLASKAIDTETINLEVLVQSRDLFLMFDTLMHSAQNRRIVLLREMSSRRSLARKYPQPALRGG